MTANIFLTVGVGYGRVATAEIHPADPMRGWMCDCCGATDVPVLVVDTSEGEYGQVVICQACVSKAFAEGA